MHLARSASARVSLVAVGEHMRSLGSEWLSQRKKELSRWNRYNAACDFNAEQACEQVMRVNSEKHLKCWDAAVVNYFHVGNPAYASNHGCALYQYGGSGPEWIIDHDFGTLEPKPFEIWERRAGGWNTWIRNKHLRQGTRQW